MRSGKTILVIDDDENVGAILRIKLEKRGDYAVLFADNGGSGMKIAISESPDLIVLDLDMPDMDGADVKLELSRHEETKDIPTMYLTSMVTAEETLKTEGKLGGQYMVSKHLDMSQIIDRILSFLDR